MKTQIAVFALVLAFGCGKSDKAPEPEPTPTPTPAPKPPAEPTGPEIVELPLPADEVPPDDCAAAGVDGGALDQTNTAYKKIEVKTHKQFVWQRATLADGTIVTAQVGGCAHHGSSYTVVMKKEKPLADRAHYIGGALEVVMKLPLRPGGEDHYTKEIAEEIKPALKDPKKLEACDFPRGEMDRVMCGISEEGRTVSVSLAYDIAL